MPVKKFIIQSFAGFQKKSIEKMAASALEDQKKILEELLSKAARTQFGLEHDFKNIRNAAAFAGKVPLRDYEEFRPYIDKIINGAEDILWPGRPKYFAKTSGTTSGIKYIPVSKDSIKHHIQTARNTILNYIAGSGADIFSHKLIFLSGSPQMESVGGIPTGRLSGIVNHEVPSWVRPHQLPSYQTNIIDDWESKLDRIVQETMDKDLSLISGIPPWVQMYFERLLEESGKSAVREVFPNFQLFIHGGVNYSPYAPLMEKMMGEGVTTLETYPASEGFIAFQDTPGREGLLLNTDAGMYFEFVDAGRIHEQNPQRLTLNEVETEKDYALVISSNAGLWAYNIGDTLRFISKDPYRIIVSGRIKHYISAFGEHVIVKEVEEAMDIVSKRHGIKLVEFTVAPVISDQEGKPACHEWFLECETPPTDLKEIEKALNLEMCRQNIYYKDLIDGAILKPLKVTILSKGSFQRYMKSMGKLGGQNKVPRLMNDRTLADALLN